jgi:lipid-binding SYLF domain-containing protein
MLMQRVLVPFTAACIFASAFTLAHAQQTDPAAAARRQEVDANAEATLNKLFSAREGSKSLYDRAAGYAVFSATKAGFVLTGGGGTGVAVDKASAKRTYMRMGMGGIGLGVGAQRYDLIILFEDEPHLSRFVTGGWDTSATAQAAAGKEGVTATSSFIDGVAIYQLTDKGLMAQADVSGTRFWVAENLN